jgi:hypothetical protein
MDSDKNELSSASVDTAENDKLSHVCKVCGSDVSLMYLGVQCCSSCKMFFRRNADLDSVSPFFLNLC